MLIRIAFIAAVMLLLAQLPGCNYFIDAAPRIIISSEPISQQPTLQCP